MPKCPYCESTLPFACAQRGVHDHTRIRCPACGFSLEINRRTRILRAVIGVGAFGAAVMLAGMGSERLSGPMAYLLLPIFCAIFAGLVHAGWALLALAAIFTNPVAPDHCAVCQYNLQGITTGICPECGTAFKTPQRHITATSLDE